MLMLLACGWKVCLYISSPHVRGLNSYSCIGITGENTTVAIVDDGLDMDSQDLAANYVGNFC